MACFDRANAVKVTGIWPGRRLLGVTGRSMVCALMAVYGPRTVRTLTTRLTVPTLTAFWAAIDRGQPACALMAGYGPAHGTYFDLSFDRLWTAVGRRVR